MNPEPDDSLYLSRSDVNEPLSSYSKHGFELDDHFWPSVEHYFQSMKFENPGHQEKVRQAEHPAKARRLGRSRFRRLDRTAYHRYQYATDRSARWRACPLQSVWKETAYNGLGSTRRVDTARLFRPDLVAIWSVWIDLWSKTSANYQ